MEKGVFLLEMRTADKLLSSFRGTMPRGDRFPGRLLQVKVIKSRFKVATLKGWKSLRWLKTPDIRLLLHCSQIRNSKSAMTYNVSQINASHCWRALPGA